MDESKFQQMLDSLKNDIFKKMNEDNHALRNDLMTSNELIKEEVNSLQTKVDNNTDTIDEIKDRMEKVEQKLYSEVLQEEPPKPKDKKVKKSEIANILDLAKRRIGISPINVDDLNRVAQAKKVK